jgi:hypothetical protein
MARTKLRRELRNGTRPPATSAHQRQNDEATRARISHIDAHAEHLRLSALAIRGPLAKARLVSCQACEGELVVEDPA